MKWLCFSLFFLFVFHSDAQLKNPKYFPDTTVTVGMSNFYQPEDLYTFVTFQLNITHKLIAEVGLGAAWRAGLGRGVSLAANYVLHYNLSKFPNLFYGPSLRFMGETINTPGSKYRFGRQAGELGYRFSYGKKLKVVQGSYLGAHNLTYNTKAGRNNRVYFGYSFQLGLVYEF